MSCTETPSSAWYMRQALLHAEMKDYAQAKHDLQMALFLFEARALRRKVTHLNKKKPEHEHVDSRFKDVPFNEMDIEHRMVGSDGHIVLTELETAWMKRRMRDGQE